MAETIRLVRPCEGCDSKSNPHTMAEWLVTNGLGGYASGTVAGAITRRYHGLLIAALRIRRVA
ncbi:MAG: glycogen debranching enzyme N-terminal domain-containing protein [Syntrophobacteraceae bacterium]